MTRLGALHYLNARPLVAGVEREAAFDSVRYEMPSLLARDLRAGELDLALVPQVEACREDDYRIVPGPCVACDGAVESILLFLRDGQAWQDVRHVGVDVSSNSSVELLRVLLETAGTEAQFTTVEPRLDGLRQTASELDGVLLIGDRALAEENSEFERVDLGTLWKQQTGLPFVFAVWLGRAGLDPAAVAAVRSVWRSGLTHRDQLAREFVREFPDVRSPKEASRYITEVIHYELGPRELESLERFHEYRHQAGRVAGPWRPRFFEEVS